jgi:hypothetical protein
MNNRKLPKPASIRTYLNAHGWREEKSLPPAGVMYLLSSIPGSDGPVTVFVPDLERADDYPLRVAEVVATLAGVEDRPERRVWAELNSPKTGAGIISQEVQARKTRPPRTTKNRPST